MIARLLPTAALLLTVCSAAWSQTPTPTQTPAPAPASPPTAAPATPAPPAALSKATAAAVDQRIKALHAELGITDQQQALWDVFATSMRDSAAATEALFERRASAAQTMSAVENMRSYAEIARAYADTMDRLSNDFASLYASLSDLQRRAADALFRKQMVAAAQPK